MQRNVQAAMVLIASGALLATACATAIVPDLDEELSEGSSGQGGGGGGGGKSGAGGTKPSGAGTNTGATTAKGGVGSSGGHDGDMGGDGGATPGSGGKAGGGSAGRAGSGGKSGAGGTGSGGKGGATGSGGKGGTGSGGKGGGGETDGGKGGSGAGTSGTAGTGGSDGGVSLITNSGFETSTTGWSVFGGGSATITRSTDQAHSGTHSLLITGRTQNYQGPQHSVLDLITPGTSYRMSVWGRLAASNPTGSLIVTLRYACGGGDKFFTWVASSAASASSWQELTDVQTVPGCSGGSMTAAAFYVESPTASLSYYIDDVVLTEE